MTKYILMLRGVNVGGKNRIKMGDLKELCASIGLVNPETYVQSGNVVFESEESDTSELENLVQKQITKKLKLDVSVFVRSKKEFQSLINKTPFAGKDTARVHVTFLSKKSSEIASDEIDSTKSKIEEYLISGREIYLFLPNGYGVSKLTNNFFERKLGVAATTRNWNTVNELLSMAS